MKIKIQKVEELEVEVELPVYRISRCFAYYVYSDEKCITVNRVKGMESISINHSGLAWVLDNSYCSKEIFEEEYNKVLKIINNKLL